MTPIADPLKDPNICGLPICEVDNEKFRYKSDTVYHYSYESSFKTFFDDTDKNDRESELFVDANVELTFPTKCQGQMRVTSVKLKNHDFKIETVASKKPKPTRDYEYEDEEEEEEDPAPNENAQNIPANTLHKRSNVFSKDIEDMSMRFSFHDGVIQEICLENDEQIWVTNFKRGILSALQNSMFRFDLDHKATETDVSGKCDVSYQFIGSAGTSIRILKSKDISSCQNRNKFKSIVQTTPYEFRRVIETFFRLSYLPTFFFLLL